MLLLATFGTILFARPFISRFTSYSGNNFFRAMIVWPGLFALIVTTAKKTGLYTAVSGPAFLQPH